MRASTWVLVTALPTAMLAAPASPDRRSRYRALTPGSRSAFSRAIAAVRRARGASPSRAETTWRVEGEYGVEGGAWACTRFAMLFDRALEARWPTADVDVFLVAPGGATRVRYVLSGVPDESASGTELRHVVRQLAEAAYRRAGVRLVDRGQVQEPVSPVPG
jgi:hypothetical protein